MLENHKRVKDWALGKDRSKSGQGTPCCFSASDFLFYDPEKAKPTSEPLGRSNVDVVRPRGAQLRAPAIVWLQQTKAEIEPVPVPSPEFASRASTCPEEMLNSSTSKITVALGGNRPFIAK